METTDLIAVGEIIKAQGISGEVKVIPLTDRSNRFGEIRRVYRKTVDGWHELVIERFRPFKQFILLKFSGINDLTAATALGRGLLYIPRSERPKLSNGRFYLDEIVGISVFTVDGRKLGLIDEILQTGANDVYCVSNKEKSLLIPALKSVVREIDVLNKRMVVELPAGLVED